MVTSMIGKAVLAFGVVVGGLYGAQHLVVSAVTTRIAAQAGTPTLPSGRFVPTMQFDPQAMRKAMGIVTIDTREGQRLAVEGAARRIDLTNRAAAAAVPLPPRR